MPRKTATVSIAGASSVVNVELHGEDTVVDVLQSALKTLGLPKESVTALEAVQDGQDAKMSDPVATGSVVTAASRVANG